MLKKLLDRPAAVWSNVGQGRGPQDVQHPLVSAVITFSCGTDPAPLPESLQGACLLSTTCMDDKLSTLQFLWGLSNTLYATQLSLAVTSGNNESAGSWHTATTAWGWCCARCARKRCHACIWRAPLYGQTPLCALKGRCSCIKAHQPSCLLWLSGMALSLL